MTEARTKRPWWVIGTSPGSALFFAIVYTMIAVLQTGSWALDGRWFFGLIAGFFYLAAVLGWAGVIWHHRNPDSVRPGR